jgi:hypothetical protein
MPLASPPSIPLDPKDEAATASARLGSGALAILAIAGFLVLVGSWVFLHSGLYGVEISDLALYEDYGQRILDGDVPYREFSLGYPPAALPVFVLPALGSADDYRGVFEFLMILSAEAALGFALLTLRAVGAVRARLIAVTAFIGLAPLALGTVVLTRYDFWPAALTAAALAALVAGRRILGACVLALAVAAKLYAVVLFPLALVYAARRDGIRAAVAPAVIFVVTLAALTLPFTLGSGSLDDAAESQTVDRPLQIESLGAAVLMAADQLGAYAGSVKWVPGVQALAGPLADTLADVTTLVQGLAVILVWVLFWRGPPSSERLLIASAAAVAAFVAFGKVLSPQYLIWLIPLVPLVAGRVGVLASGLLAAALLLTQAWFPSRYFDVVALEPISWAVLGRDLVLVALFATLALHLRPSRVSSEVKGAG